MQLLFPVYKCLIISSGIRCTFTISAFPIPSPSLQPLINPADTQAHHNNPSIDHIFSVPNTHQTFPLF